METPSTLKKSSQRERRQFRQQQRLKNTVVLASGMSTRTSPVASGVEVPASSSMEEDLSSVSGEEELLGESEPETTGPNPSGSTGAEASGDTGGGGKGARPKTSTKRPSGKTPPEGQKRGKRPKKTPMGSTFQQAERDELLGIVLAADDPYMVLSRTQLTALRVELMRKLERAIDAGSGVIPRFQESGLRHGRFCVSCVDPDSYAWVQSAVESTTVEVDGTNSEIRLVLVKPSEVPRYYRAEVYVYGPPPGVPKFLKLIQGQNPSITTNHWILRHQQQSEKGMLMIWHIDQKTSDQLIALGDQLYCGLGRVTFRVARTTPRGEEPL
jgi:hypothetical protein